MSINIKKYQQTAIQKKNENEKFFKKLKERPPKGLDNLVDNIHRKVSAQIDCLSCANCCKTTSPLFTSTYIERIAKLLKMKPHEFEQTYLQLDQDNDWVYNTTPCPFLGADNYCFIYEHRPKACREYPHTNRKKIYQISKITIKNTEICPIAFEVVEELKQITNKK